MSRHFVINRDKILAVRFVSRDLGFDTLPDI